MGNEIGSILRKLFPRGSKSFFDANPGLPASVAKQNVRATVVHKAQGKTKSDARPIVSIVMYRVRLLDKDNAYGAAKPLIDCLRKIDLIPGDSEDEIQLIVSQEKVAHRIDQHTNVSIKYPL